MCSLYKIYLFRHVSSGRKYVKFIVIDILFFYTANRWTRCLRFSTTLLVDLLRKALPFLCLKTEVDLSGFLEFGIVEDEVRLSDGTLHFCFLVVEKLFLFLISACC
jgi:hypothetical protein